MEPQFRELDETNVGLEKPENRVKQLLSQARINSDKKIVLNSKENWSEVMKREDEKKSKKSVNYEQIQRMIALRKDKKKSEELSAIDKKEDRIKKMEKKSKENAAIDQKITKLSEIIDNTVKENPSSEYFTTTTQDPLSVRPQNYNSEELQDFSRISSLLCYTVGSEEQHRFSPSQTTQIAPSKSFSNTPTMLSNILFFKYNSLVEGVIIIF